MKQYHDALAHVLETGTPSTDRTGTGTISAFGLQTRYAMADGFPLVTTKKLHLRSIIYELLWFLSGDTNIAYLKENGVSIWDEWADEAGDLGPMPIRPDNLSFASCMTLPLGGVGLPGRGIASPGSTQCGAL